MPFDRMCFTLCKIKTCNSISGNNKDGKDKYLFKFISDVRKDKKHNKICGNIHYSKRFCRNIWGRPLLIYIYLHNLYEYRAMFKSKFLNAQCHAKKITVELINTPYVYQVTI